jgi:hypothetical protein
VVQQAASKSVPLLREVVGLLQARTSMASDCASQPRPMIMSRWGAATGSEFLATASGSRG